MEMRFTPKEFDKLMTEHFVILVDTQEKVNQHITDYFDERQIKWKNKSLQTGDYSLLVTKCEELGIMMDMYFTDELCIERKGSLDELVGNFANASKDEGRVFREFRRMYGGVRNYLIVEDASIEDVLLGNYRSNMNSTAVLRTILSLQVKNGLTPLFVKKEATPKLIYELCLSALKAHIAK
jgi:ERCC4-type nuclease